MRRLRTELIRGQGYDVRVIGGRRGGWRDAYHWFLIVPWWQALGVIAMGYLALNALFAGLYLLSGGIEHAAPGSFLDAFFFSVQTMGTIGYGTMEPVTRLANTLVVAESVTGLFVIALATGLVFARFSRTRGRVAFSSKVAIAPIDGVPHLMIRVGNERRRNNIVDAVFRLTVMRTTRTAEGVTVYRTVDVPLVRSSAPALQRSWMVLHRIDPESPLARETPDSLVAVDAELTLSVSGIDDTSLQPVHARHTWLADSVVFGARLADVVSETAEGITLDLRRFHDLVPTEPVPGFPFPPAAQDAPAQPPGKEPVAIARPAPVQVGRPDADAGASARS